MPASGGFPHSPGQPDFTFQPVEHLHQHRREHHTATVFAAGLLKRIRRAAALRSGQFTGGSFNSDEWCEAPRLINRLDAGSVVLYCGQPVAVPAVPVTCGFRDSDIQPVRSRSRRHTRFATLRPSGS